MNLIEEMVSNVGQEEAGKDYGLRACKKRATRSALERATLQLVTEKGFEGATVDDICARANVSRMTFFNYFPSKLDAVLGYSEKPLCSGEIEQLLDSAPDDCYLDALVNLIYERCASDLDPEIDEMRRNVLAGDIGLLLREKQGLSKLCQEIADALEAYLYEHPNRRMLTAVSPKEEARLGSSFAGFLARTFTVWRVNIDEQVSVEEIRRLFQAYTQA